MSLKFVNMHVRTCHSWLWGNPTKRSILLKMKGHVRILLYSELNYKFENDISIIKNKYTLITIVLFKYYFIEDLYQNTY